MHRYSNRKLTRTEIDSLIAVNQIPSESRWYPYSVEELSKELSYGSFKTLNNNIKKNIIYTLQYLEYVDLQLKELILPNVIKTLLWKNYIINSLAIIEAVFYHLLSNSNLLKTSKYGKVKGFKELPGTFEKNGKIYKKVEGRKEVFNTPQFVNKEFHQLIDDVFSNDLLTVDKCKLTIAKGEIKYLKKIRNKIHLQNNEICRPDYNTITEKDFWLVRYVLFRILTDPIFDCKQQIIFPKLAKKSYQVINDNRFQYDLSFQP